MSELITIIGKPATLSLDISKPKKLEANIDAVKVIRIEPQREQIVVRSEEAEYTVLPTGDKVIHKVTVLPIPEEYVVPEGTLEITDNGKYNVKEYFEVDVIIDKREDLDAELNSQDALLLELEDLINKLP